MRWAIAHSECRAIAGAKKQNRVTSRQIVAGAGCTRPQLHSSKCSILDMHEVFPTNTKEESKTGSTNTSESNESATSATACTPTPGTTSSLASNSLCGLSSRHLGSSAQSESSVTSRFVYVFPFLLVVSSTEELPPSFR